jgi:hypothetical protein
VVWGHGDVFQPSLVAYYVQCIGTLLKEQLVDELDSLVSKKRESERGDAMAMSTLVAS